MASDNGIDDAGMAADTPRRMAELSVADAATAHLVSPPGRRSPRGNWHARPRIGIMGGTFDPIHNGHLVAASEVSWVYDLDEVIFVPTGRPVFKLDKHVTNAEDRYLMTVIATASNPKFTVSRVDIDRPGVTCVTCARCTRRPNCSSSRARTPSPRSCSGRTSTRCSRSRISSRSHAPDTRRRSHCPQAASTCSRFPRSRSHRPMCVNGRHMTNRCGIWSLTASSSTSASTASTMGVTDTADTPMAPCSASGARQLPALHWGHGYERTDVWRYGERNSRRQTR